MTVNSLISVTALLLFAGFLAGSESAINSISRVFVEELQVKSSRAAAWVQKVVKEPARYLNVILFVNLPPGMAMDSPMGWLGCTAHVVEKCNISVWKK